MHIYVDSIEFGMFAYASMFPTEKCEQKHVINRHTHTHTHSQASGMVLSAELSSENALGLYHCVVVLHRQA